MTPPKKHRGRNPKRLSSHSIYLKISPCNNPLPMHRIVKKSALQRNMPKLVGNLLTYRNRRKDPSGSYEWRGRSPVCLGANARWRPEWMRSSLRAIRRAPVIHEDPKQAWFIDHVFEATIERTHRHSRAGGNQGFSTFSGPPFREGAPEALPRFEPCPETREARLRLAQGAGTEPATRNPQPATWMESVCQHRP